MKHRKVFQVMKKDETNTRNIHYINADSKKQALAAARQIWPKVNQAFDVSDKWKAYIVKGDFPDYVIIAGEWIN